MTKNQSNEYDESICFKGHFSVKWKWWWINLLQGSFLYQFTSLFAYDKDKKTRYQMFMLLCTVSFSTYLVVVLLWYVDFTSITSCFCDCSLQSCAFLYSALQEYRISLPMIFVPLIVEKVDITLYYRWFWVGLFSLACLIFLCRFVFWLLKKLCRFVLCLWWFFCRY